MTMLLTEKTKQEKITNEAQKRRNLFGLGLTSLIAACSAAENAAENAATEVGIGKRPETALEAAPLDPTHTIDSDSGAITAIEGDSDNGARANSVQDLRITVTPEQRGLDSSADPLVLRIANGDHVDIRNAFVYKELTTTDKHDLVVAAQQFGDADGTEVGKTGAVYIFWDIGNIMPGAIPINTATTAVKTLEQKHLKVEGSDASNVISGSNPEFYYIGGTADQYDMFFRSSKGYNILWDVTKYASDVKTELTLGTDAGILQILAAGEANRSFIKINNNDNYDMIVKGSADTYILWDVAEYQKATDAKAVVNLAAPDTIDEEATHGLLTIKGLGEAIKTVTMGNGEVGYTDIDGGGINDLAFDIGGNIYILFGEKVANRDGNGKAISHTVDVEIIYGSVFYDKTGNDRNAVTAIAPAEKEGFFDFNLDGEGDVKNVGYRFAAAKRDDLTTLADIKDAYEDANPPATDGTPALSEEVYWDIA